MSVFALNPLPKQKYKAGNGNIKRIEESLVEFKLIFFTVHMIILSKVVKSFGKWFMVLLFVNNSRRDFKLFICISVSI